jgi:hypothetical protein
MAIETTDDDNADAKTTITTADSRGAPPSRAASAQGRSALGRPLSTDEIWDWRSLISDDHESSEFADGSPGFAAIGDVRCAPPPPSPPPFTCLLWLAVL